MSLIPKPLNAPQTLQAMYQHYTGDLTTLGPIIEAAVRKDRDIAELWALSLLMKGYSNTQIAAASGVRSRSILSQTQRIMRRAFKLIHNLPRYDNGHKGNVLTLKQNQPRKVVDFKDKEAA